MGGAGKTWYASIANSGLVQIPSITGGVGVDVVRQHQGLGFSATVRTEVCVCWKMCDGRGMHVCPWIDEYDI